MKKLQINMTFLILTGCFLLLASCGQSSNIGTMETGGIDAQNVNITMVHRFAIEQQLRNVFGLPSGNASLNYLFINRAIFDAVSSNNISRRNATYKLYISACYQSDKIDPTLLFDKPDAPTIEDIWHKFQPGEKVPAEITDGANAIEGINLESAAQKRMALCLLASTSLCNTTQNVPCLVDGE